MPGRLLHNVRFTQAHRWLYFVAEMWSVPTADTAAAFVPVFRGHPRGRRAATSVLVE